MFHSKQKKKPLKNTLQTGVHESNIIHIIIIVTSLFLRNLAVTTKS